MKPFVNIHNHTTLGSFDSVITPGRFVERIKELGQEYVVQTDHGTLGGMVQVAQAARKAGLKYIPGLEAYVSYNGLTKEKDELGNLHYHMLLLARNRRGFENLLQIIYRSYKEDHFYYKPRIDFRELQELSEGLIVTTGCLASRSSKLIMAEREDLAEQYLRELQQTFGNSLYAEVQDSGCGPEQAVVNKVILGMAQDLGIPAVATSDAHFASPCEGPLREMFLKIRHGAIGDDENEFYKSGNLYLKSGDELAKLFGDEAIANTVDLASRCDVDLKLGRSLFPAPTIPETFAPEEDQEQRVNDYLRHLAEEGLQERGFADLDEYRSRLDSELQTISELGFSPYFLIVWDLVEEARRRGVLVGPGRGSAAGSIVCFCLKITGLDPIEHGLFFSRFLNKSRVSWPDIDIDFCKSRRSELFQYLSEKYGEDKVAHIMTFAGMKPKSMARDVGRMLGNPKLGSQIAELIPPDFQGRSVTVAEALEQEPRLHDPKFAVVTDKMLLLEGLTRSQGTHAAGAVISPEPIYQVAPTGRHGKEKHWTVQVDMDEIEQLGLVKLDVLGLRTLTVIDNCLSMIDGIEKPEDIPVDDPAVYRNLWDTPTMGGFFQFENNLGMAELLRRILPQELGDLGVGTALFRPGPLGTGMDKQYCANREEGWAPVPGDPLDKITAETYGAMVYQEQCAAHDSPVWTTKGMKRIQNVKAGDMVYTSAGPRAVLGWKQTGFEKCLRVTTSSGEFSVTSEHRVKVCREGKEQFVFAKDLDPARDIICMAEPLPQDLSPENLSSLEIEELKEAYRLGVLVGDGCITKLCVVAAGPKEAANHIAEIFKEWGRPVVYHHTRCWYVRVNDHSLGPPVKKGEFRSKVNQRLHEYGLLGKSSKTKTTPKWVFESKPRMIGFLIGLIESDGHNGHSGPSHVTSTNSDLLDEIAWICHQLGIATRARELRIYFDSIRSLAPFADKIGTFKSFTEESLQTSENLVYDRIGLRRRVDELRGDAPLREWSVEQGFSAGRFRHGRLPFCTERRFSKTFARSLSDLPRYSFIKKIEETEAVWVYDLKVEEVPEFNLGGHIVHNCISLCVQVAGFSEEDGDRVRKVLGKKKVEEVEKWREPFVKGCIETSNLDESRAQGLFESIAEGASYLFNKSHALAYSLISYWCMYLRYYYPAEFMAACLNASFDNKDKLLRAVNTCKQLGVEILPPSIETLSPDCAKVGEMAVSLGAKACKYLKKGAAPAIETIQEKKPDSLFDFFSRVNRSKFNKGKAEAFVKCGAMDNLAAQAGLTRTGLLQGLEYIYEYFRKCATKVKQLHEWEKRMARREEQERLKAAGEDYGGRLVPKRARPVLPEFDLSQFRDVPENPLETALAEFEVMKLCVSDWPLRYLNASGKATPIEVAEAGGYVTVAGIVSGFKEHRTKKGDKRAAFTLEDQTGLAFCNLFPKTLEKYPGKLKDGACIEAKGRAKRSGETLEIAVSEYRVLRPVPGLGKLIEQKDQRERRPNTPEQLVRLMQQCHAGTQIHFGNLTFIV